MQIPISATEDEIMALIHIGYGVFYYAFIMIPIVSLLGISVSLTMNNDEIMILSAERQQ